MKFFDITESAQPLKNECIFESLNICTVRYRIETAAFVGSRIWSYMPRELKESMSLNVFRSKIKTWDVENWPCKLCKIYLQRIGYLQVTNQYLFMDTIIYVSSFAACLFCWIFLLFAFAFVFFLISSPPFFSNSQFKVDLNQPHISDKDYIVV